MAEALRRRDVSAEELVTRALRRAEDCQATTNAFSQIWAEEALAEARRIDANRDESRPFAGVPVAVKDLFDVAGHETTACCAAFAGNRAAEDSPTVAAIRKAGLVTIGKTNQHEMAAGGTNAVSACGPTHNPWDLERVTGGSSGGSGAVVAAGALPWAFGSDTGGSVRIPASFCGTFGLKPTTGQLSTAGMLPLAPSLDCPGPMAATVEDLAALYALMAGSSVPTGSAAPQAVAGRRLGVVGGYFARMVHPMILAAVDAAAADFGRTGLQVEAVDGEGIDDVRSVWRRITYSEFAAAYQLPPERYERIDPSVRDWMEQGRGYSPDQLDEARRRRQGIAAWFNARLESHAALLVPTTPYWAPRYGQQEIELGDETINLDDVGPGWYTCAANIAGLPAVSLPAGSSPDDAPFGVSLVGRAGDEATLLALAALWASAVGYTPRFPRQQ
jgi:aspartyl-tRNA(Asn)/glutamyl-tRNA(Gln) amidotransferase subunit A